MKGGDDEERNLAHLFGRRPIVDQLKDLVLEYHRSRRSGEVLADREDGLVDHRDAALLEIVDEILVPLREALPLGFNRELQGLGVRGREVRGAQRVHDLPREELEFLLAVGFELRGVRELREPSCVQQV